VFVRRSDVLLIIDQFEFCEWYACRPIRLTVCKARARRCNRGVWRLITANNRRVYVSKPWRSIGRRVLFVSTKVALYYKHCVAHNIRELPQGVDARRVLTWRRHMHRGLTWSSPLPTEHNTSTLLGFVNRQFQRRVTPLPPAFDSSSTIVDCRSWVSYRSLVFRGTIRAVSAS